MTGVFNIINDTLAEERSVVGPTKMSFVYAFSWSIPKRFIRLRDGILQVKIFTDSLEFNTSFTNINLNGFENLC